MALQGSNLKQQIGDASPGSSFGTIGSSPGHVYQVHHSAVPDAAPNYANQYSDNSVHAPQQGSADGMPTYQQTLALSMRGLNMNGIAAVSPHRMTHEETLPQVMSMSGVHSEFPVDSAGVEQQQQDWYRAQMQPSNGSVVDGAPQAYNGTQGINFSPAATSPDDGRQSWSFPAENGNTHAMAMSPCRQNNDYTDATFSDNRSIGLQHGYNRYPAAVGRQASVPASILADGANLGVLEASGRSYSTGDQNGDGSGLWSYGSAGMQPEAGMWGGAGGGTKEDHLQLTQRAGHWESGRVSQPGGLYANGSSNGGVSTSTAKKYGSGGPNQPGNQNNTNNNAGLVDMNLSQHAAPGPVHFQGQFVQQQQQQQQLQYSYSGAPSMTAAMSSQQDILGRHLAQLGLDEDMAAQQAANAQERERRQQQLTYLKLLQQQQSNIRRQQQQLSQQQQAIASAAASLQHGYGQQMQQGGGMRQDNGSPSLQMRPEPSYQRMQKQLYQQQPATVGLRGQPPIRQVPTRLRMNQQQRPMDQNLQHSSLSIHDKRRQPVAPLKRLPKADVTWLSQQLSQAVTSLMPTSEECTRQATAFDQVLQVLKARWPEGQVHLFGSTANCLAITNNNDIDVCLELTDLEDDPIKKSEVVEEMARLLEAAGMRDVLPLGKARVPVVKCIVPETGTQVDVTLNHTMAIINTKLLADYCAIDGRLMQLAFIVKHWAKRRQVNDAYRGTLSSYCYVLMCIHLLQQRSPPILPCLQAMQPHTHQKRVGQWDCNYYDKVGNLVSFGSANTESLGELVWAFFEYWAWKHDYNTAVVSVRTGGFLTKAQKEWTRRIGNERHLVSIEDPFELSHDLGRTVDRQTSMVLHKEFERAACILRDLPGGIEKLLEPYRAGKTD